MAVSRHITASAHQNGNFTAGKLATITLKKPIYTYCTVKPAGWRRRKLLMPVKALDALVKFSK